MGFRVFFEPLTSPSLVSTASPTPTTLPTVPTNTPEPVATATTPTNTSVPTRTPTATAVPTTSPSPTFVPSSGLVRGATISGRVTDAETGLPIADVDVAAGPMGVPELSHIYRVRTDANGNYTLTGIREGIIGFHSDDTQGYIGDIGGTVTVGIAEMVTGFNYSLRRGASISGRVIDVDTGLPIAGVRINAEEDGEGPGGSSADADTDRDGRYSLSGLIPRVYVLTAEGETEGYIRQYYDDKHTWEDAARFDVTGTETVEGIDFGLNRGAAISGRVIDAVTGLPIANMDVRAAPVDGDDISWAETDLDGRYTLKGIPDGVVEVVVAGQGYLETSKTVTVRNGQDVTGFDF